MWKNNLTRFLRNASLRRSAWALTLLLGAALAHAELVPDLYKASVPVSEQSQAEMQRGTRAGLVEVLVRVSGRSDAEQNPALAQALAQPERYLNQYRYERHPSPVPAGQPWLLKMSFAEGPVEQLVRGAGLPVWGANRPNVLVWLVLDDGRSRAFVNEGSQPDIVAALREQARRRGLVLHFPLLDISDNAVSTEDAWQLDVAKIQPISERYHADGLLIGRLMQGAGGRWQGAWALAVNGQRTNAENDGDTLPNYLAPGINRVADTLASMYAIAAGAADEGLMLRLVGVGNFDDYARALAYLQQLAAVKAVNPVQVRGDEVFLRLRIEGSVEQLTRQLALDNRFAPQADPPAAGPGGQTVQLQYRWIPPVAG